MTYLRIAWGKVKCRFGWHQWETADFYDDEHFPYPRNGGIPQMQEMPVPDGD